MSKSLEKLKKFIKECPLSDIKMVNVLPNNEVAVEGIIYLVHRVENDIDFFDEYIFSNSIGFIKTDSYEMTGEQEGEINENTTN